MSKSPAAKMRNHQWRRTDPLDELWFSRVGHRMGDSLNGSVDTLASGPLTLQPMAAFAENSLLESRLHALVNAMAVFTPAAQGLAVQQMHSGPKPALLIAVDSGP